MLAEIQSFPSGYLTSPPQAGCDAGSIFKWSESDLNLDFSFS